MADMESNPPVEAPDGSAIRPPAGPFPKVISFESLVRCGDEIWIENAGQLYRLRRTKLGKLILTK